jgi:hypothetical protein
MDACRRKEAPAPPTAARRPRKPLARATTIGVPASFRTAYGIAHFQVDPGKPGGDTTITVTCYHAPTQTVGTPEYSVLESFQLTRPRSDRLFGHPHGTRSPSRKVAIPSGR